MSSAAAVDGNILELEDVHTFYGSIEALKGISIQVQHGEVVTLIGANGAGKSTTLRSINGLNNPRRGRIRFQGRDITNASAHDIVKFGQRVGECYTAAYGNEPFVRLLEGKALPDTKNVAGTNVIEIAWRLDPRTGRLVAMSAEDNLVKGAAGQFQCRAPARSCRIRRATGRGVREVRLNSLPTRPWSDRSNSGEEHSCA